MKSIVLFLTFCGLILYAESNNNTLNLTARSLIQVQIISRHCDRIPDSTAEIPTDPVDWQEVTHLNPGDLTVLGKSQCKQLGTNLGERYLKDGVLTRIKDISSNYNSTQFLFRSTKYPRTKKSLTAIASGLFRQELGDVPIFIDANGYLLLGSVYCNAVQNRVERATTEKVNPYITANRVFIDNLYSATGWVSDESDDLTNLRTLFDLLYVQKAHDMLNIRWVNDNWTQILKTRDDILSILCSYDVIGKEGSSKLIQTLIDNMVSQNKKYIHYSAHDITLQALTGALKLNINSSLGGVPDFGAHIAVELYQNLDSGNKTVRFMHADQFDSELIPLILTNLGCTTEYCPLNTFKQLATQQSISADWCVACDIHPCPNTA